MRYDPMLPNGLDNLGPGSYSRRSLHPRTPNKMRSVSRGGSPLLVGRHCRGTKKSKSNAKFGREPRRDGDRASGGFTLNGRMILKNGQPWRAFPTEHKASSEFGMLNRGRG